MATGVTVQRQEDADGTREWIETQAGRPLRPWVSGYTGYREAGTRPVRRVETPSGGAVLVLSFGDRLTVSHAPRAGGAGSTGAAEGPRCVLTSFAGGLDHRPVLTSHNGRQHGIQVRLEPPAVYALLGAPLDELGREPGGVVDLADLGLAGWGDRLGDVPGWGRRFAMLDELLIARLARCTAAPSPDVLYAWRRLRASHGNVSVAALVRESGTSHATFLRSFRRQVGVGPKVAGRILRYERATALLSEGCRPIARVAAECGYADQAHMAREFGTFAGRPPSRFLEDRQRDGYQSIRSIVAHPSEEG